MHKPTDADPKRHGYPPCPHSTSKQHSVICRTVLSLIKYHASLQPHHLSLRALPSPNLFNLPSSLLSTSCSTYEFETRYCLPLGSPWSILDQPACNRRSNLAAHNCNSDHLSCAHSQPRHKRSRDEAMTMLASKSPYPAPLGMSNGHAPTSASSQYSAGLTGNRIPAMISSIQNVASPTESEFSEIYEGNESVRYVYLKSDRGLEEDLSTSDFAWHGSSHRFCT